MPSWLRSSARPLVFVLFVVSAYSLVRFKRAELVDFVVPLRAAERFQAEQPLYRPDDGHFQYKYFPAFAQLMVPFTWLPKEPAQFTWFTLTVLMAWGFVRLSLAALPERRRSERVLFWITLLLTGKFFVKELAFGQFNLPLALLLLGGIIAAQRGQPFAAGALVAAGVFVKPYALIMLPWLLLTLGWRPLVSFAAVCVAGLLLPAVTYGWEGNIFLLREWYRTVSDTTAPNLLGSDTISFASMWVKWIGAGTMAARLALVTSVGAVAAGIAIILRRQQLKEPNYLEGAYFFLLIPLLSPQGWDYVLVIALPAYVCLLDRLGDLTPSWRVVALMGFFLTSFTIWDLLRRTLYGQLMQISAVTIGAMLIAACLVHLRWRALA